jgi:hypothetical protein
MVASSNDKFCIGQTLSDNFKSLNHQFEPLVGSPFSKSKNAVLRIAAPRKVGILGPGGQNTVRTEMHIIAPIFILQNLQIPWHQHRHRIRQQKHSGGNGSCQAIGSGVPHAGILQVYSVHQVMKGYVCVTSA